MFEIPHNRCFLAKKACEFGSPSLVSIGCFVAVLLSKCSLSKGKKTKCGTGLYTSVLLWVWFFVVFCGGFFFFLVNIQGRCLYCIRQKMETDH